MYTCGGYLQDTSMLIGQWQSLPTELVTHSKHQALCVHSLLQIHFPVTTLGYTHLSTTYNTLACLLDSTYYSALSL